MWERGRAVTAQLSLCLQGQGVRDALLSLTWLNWRWSRDACAACARGTVTLVEPPRRSGVQLLKLESMVAATLIATVLRPHPVCYACLA